MASRDEHMKRLLSKSLGREETDNPRTKTLGEDPFEVVSGDIVNPPYDPAYLSMLPETSNMLGTSIRVMMDNIPGFGHHINDVFEPGPPEDLIEDVKKEKLWIENSIKIFPRGRSFLSLRKELRSDLEKTGNAYLEIIRHPATGEVVGGKVVPSSRVRIGRQDAEFTEYKLKVPVTDEDETIHVMEIPDEKRFRFFVESVYHGRPSGLTGGNYAATGRAFGLRYFKSYGDPRTIDSETGNVVTEAEMADFQGSGRPMPRNRMASEIYHFRLPTCRGPYGIPRWIATMIGILGTETAEQANLSTVGNNGVPSFAVSVSGGRLTSGTISRIKEYVENFIAGNSSYSTFLILEGESDVEDESSAQVKISITPLSANQIQDELFSKYSETNEARVRQAFRIPKQYYGESDVGAGRSVLEEIRSLTDTQVFAGERDEDDWFFNNVLFAEWGVKYHRFRSNTPNITDNRVLVALAVALERTGSMTPRVGRAIAREVFPLISSHLSEYDELIQGGLNPDLPFSLQMADRVKNQAQANEPGQQVAPVVPPVNPDEVVKSMDSEWGDLAEAIDDEIKRLVKMFYD